MESTNLKQWVQKAALVGASLGCAMLLAELALRVTGLASADHGIFTVSQSSFEALPGIWEPHQSQLVRDKPDLPYVVTTNGLGYRGRVFSRTPSAGEFRVLYVGDSFVFGDYVDDDETLPASLEKRLARWCDEVTVVNAGLGGSTITEHLPLMLRGMALSPDLVVLQFSENDVTDLASNMWLELEANRLVKSRFPMSLIYPRVRRTALWNLALRVRANSRIRQAAIAPPSSSDSTQETRVPDSATNVLGARRARYRALLADFSEELRDRGIPFVYVVYPDHHSVYNTGRPDQLEWLSGVTEDLEINTVDLLPVLRASDGSPEDLYLLPIDGHPSALGYEIAAEEIAALITAHHSCS